MIKKIDFIAAVAERAKVSPAMAQSVLDAVAAIVPEQLASAGQVRVPGLVNLHAKEYGARPGRNLTTGEPCMVPAAIRLRMAPTASLEKSFRDASKGAATAL